MSNTISIDIGYGHTKVMYQDKIVKFNSSICFANDVGDKYGEANVYEFEGSKYYVGKDAVNGDSFSTTDYKFIEKFAPLLIFYILEKFEKVNLEIPVIVNTGLSIGDWDKKDSFIERISNICVNNKTIKITPRLMPQGAGCVVDWVNNKNNKVYPDNITVIDIGFQTINFLNFADGIPQKRGMKSYTGHGVTSIIKPFMAFLENKFEVSFSEQEALKIFTKNKFIYNGKNQTEVINKISELKTQFVQKLFQSVLRDDKKQLALSDVVLIAGGGAYLLQDVKFPPNVKLTESPYEYANCRGYALSK